MNPLLNIAIRAARRAGQIAYRHFGNLESHQISNKTANDFVTDVDRWAETDIVETIQKFYPSHGIIGEEGHEKNLDADYCWIIDPLDGTKNYIKGIPHFCVSIAITEKQKLAHAVIYNPITDELFTASRGEGARLNDKRIRLNQSQTIKGAFLSTGFPHKSKEKLPYYLLIFEDIYKQSSSCRCTGSAALDLAYVAAGRFDGFWELSLEPWDFAAGALIIQEAGGKACDASGNPLPLMKSSVVAGNNKITQTIVEIIRAKTTKDT